MKAPNSMFNTHIKSVKGLVSIGSLMLIKTSVDVRFTSDTHETLSLTVDNNIQIAVPFEKVWELIEETRAERNEISGNETN